MNNKTGRLQAIKQIIRDQKIGNQEELQGILKGMGYIITQATLSRDLSYLKAGKIPDGKGGFYYNPPLTDDIRETDDDLVQDIYRGFVSIDFSGNLGLLHTLPGHAHSVAFALDNLKIPQVLGTVAGDDTIILVLKEGADKRDFLAAFMGQLPQLEIEE
ncbi:MAG: ArgR family transcriptional regulator [Spirochaetales bacterium]|nr:MAG: ArgR family transcriptional regulator [Spirochaetales bacterium]